MSIAATFLGGAKDRLLPASVPFRYFMAAVIFQILAWAALILGADELAEFVGGTGYVLAALHLLTLGVLVMTAMGASFQLLPVATRKPLQSVWPAQLAFWIFVPGVLLLAFGMLDGDAVFLHAGGAGVVGGLLIFAVLTALNLRKPAGFQIVALHGWGALLALVVVASLGLALVIDFSTGFFENRQQIAMIHMVLAIFGFMGLLVFGFSQILIPMFVLSRNLPLRASRIEVGLSFAAIIGAAVSLFYDSTAGLIAATGIGLAAAGMYLWLMRSAFQTRMRKRLGLSFVLIKISWGMMILGLLIGLAVVVGAPVPNGMVLTVFVLLVGWLLTFLMGILQRIMPFLASMHASGRGGKPPLLSELTAEGPLKVHAICHGVAFILGFAGIVAGVEDVIRIAAGFGFIGALAFTVFAGLIVIKITGNRLPFFK